MWFVSKITDYLADENMTEEERSVLQYGIERIAENLAGCMILLAAGCCFGNGILGVLLWIALFPLRSNAGGYHASTRGNCIWISIITVLMAFVLMQSLRGCMEVQIILCMICALIIWFLAPVGSQNKPLDEREQSFYRRRVRIVLIIEILFALVSFVIHRTGLFTAIEMAFWIIAASLLAGTFQNSR